jgi:multidrug efflux pump subunit AcrA (membrane-fusion protein)
MAEEMIVFARCYDLLAWLMPKAEKFPRAFRFNVTQRLMDAALDLQEALFQAQSERAAARLAALRVADAALSRLRLYLRLAHQWRWLSPGQYEHVSGTVAEIGRLLGGWIKQTSG